VEASLRGYSAAILAYGQSGTGKRHTLFGSWAYLSSMLDGSTRCSDSSGSQGILCHSLDCLAGLLGALPNTTIGLVYVNFFEIEQERVHDLLVEPDAEVTGCRVRCRPPGLTFKVEGARHRCVRSLDDMRAAFADGWRRHMSLSTRLAGTAPRRTTMIFKISVETYETTSSEGQCIVRTGVLNFVKLPGSERLQRGPGLVGEARQAEQTRRPLMAFHRVIEQLAKRQSAARPQRVFVPWRESCLTMLLHDSLDKGQTLVIGTCGPSHRAMDETYSTLRFLQWVRSLNVGARCANESDARALSEEEQMQIELEGWLTGSEE